MSEACGRLGSWAPWAVHPIVLAVAWLVTLCTMPADAAWAAEPADQPRLRAALAPLVQHGGVAVGEDGRAAFAYRPGSYVPASIIKLATALAAFHRLGPDYRFRTEVYRAGDRLYVRGYGDPFLVSEEWALIAAELREAGALARPIERIVIDESAFAPGIEIDGAEGSLNPYDAKLGAVVANFNTVFVEVAADGRVGSAEPQTPLTPLARTSARGLPPGQHRINFTALGLAGVRYAGELARAMFARAGATIRSASAPGRVPDDAQLLLSHRSSRPLSEVVRGMMEFSNNFIANQIVLVMALERAGEPARLEPGLEAIRAYLSGQLGLRAEDFTLHEGSGLSRGNRFELGAMLRVVDAFHPWASLLKPYGRQKVPAKTGTLTGVYTLAGFLPAPDGHRRPFVIMLNQPRHTRGAVFRRIYDVFAALGR